MTEIEEIIQRDKEKLEWLYSKANTKSKKKRLLRDLFYFSYLSQDCFGINQEFSWERDEELHKLFEDTIFSFIDYTLENKDLINNITENTIKIFQNANYCFYNYNKPYNYLTEFEFQDIIFNFLNQYDPKLLQKAKDRMDNLEIFSGRAKEYWGLSFPIYSLNKNYLLYPPASENNIITASILVHEIGHSYESDILKECVSARTIDSTDKAPYFEVVSNFFEYSFLNYLKENKIYIHDTERAINYYYMALLDRAFDISILYKIKNIKLDKYGEIEIDNDEIVKYGEEIKEKLNCHFLSSEFGTKINYRDSFIYGIGSLFSIYLYENYKNDPNNFKKEFKNAIVNYPYSYMEAFEAVGVTEERLINGDVLKRILKDSR